jgi:conjugative transposon TraM protein
MKQGENSYETNNSNGNNTATPSSENNAYNEQMRVFRDQMKIMDSLQKASNPGESSTQPGKELTAKRKQQQQRNYTGLEEKTFEPSKDSSVKPLPVTKTKQATTEGFNTIRPFSEMDNIAAMIDEELIVRLGSRVRIKLLSDIYVGGNLIEKGTYIYGVVTGFQTQRVNIGIAQIQYNNTPVPVKLDVFDNDGYLGLYVPGSNFREFTKEIGTQGTQGLSQVATTDNSNVTGNLLGAVFNTTTTTLSKLVRQDKAKLKYNYIVYLREKNN